MARKRMFYSSTDKYWYDVETGAIDDRPGKFHVQPKPAQHIFLHTDDLPGGVNGMLSHADGKRYDSKSQYERAVKASGCRVVGNDYNGAQWKTPLERGIRGDYNVRAELKQALQKVCHA